MWRDANRISVEKLGESWNSHLKTCQFATNSIVLKIEEWTKTEI